MKRIAALAVGIAVMFAPGSALAQSSTCQAYNPQQCNILSGTGTPTSGNEAATSAAASSRSLPFTGMDLGFLAGCGAVLIAGGGLVRSRAKRLE